MAKKLTLEQFQKKNPYTTGLETEYDLELFLESKKYDRLWVYKVGQHHWEHLVEFLGIVPGDSDEDFYYFYFQGSEGYINAFPTEIGWTIWLWIDPEEYKANNTLQEMLEQSAFSWGLQGLDKALDGNYGGTFNSQTRAAASLIIYG